MFNLIVKDPEQDHLSDLLLDRDSRSNRVSSNLLRSLAHFLILSATLQTVKLFLQLALRSHSRDPELSGNRTRQEARIARKDQNRLPLCGTNDEPFGSCWSVRTGRLYLLGTSQVPSNLWPRLFSSTPDSHPTQSFPGWNFRPVFPCVADAKERLATSLT